MWLHALPTDKALIFESHLFLLAVRLRLLLPVPSGSAFCTCGAQLDEWGIHLLACMQTGRISRRAKLHEQAVWQILREAGASSQFRPFLRDLSVVPGIGAADARKLDVVASGLPVYGGRTIVVDATLRSPLTGNGMWRFNAHQEDGATFAQAVRDKHQKYPELAAQALRVQFVVAASEVGGRCNDQMIDLVRQLARHKASTFAPPLRASMRTILARRYWGIISVATQRAVAQCVSPELGAPTAAVFPLPDLETLCSCHETPDVSRRA